MEQMRRKRKGFLLMRVVLALVMIITMVNVGNVEVYATASENAISTTDKDALKADLNFYVSVLNADNKLSEAAQTQIKGLLSTALSNIDNTTEDTGELSSYLASVKAQMDTIAANELSVVSDYLVLTDNIPVPTAEYGQQVNVILSILNLSDVPLSDLIVTPLVDTSVIKWPFELEAMGYTKVIANIPGSTTYDEAFAGRQEITYTFTTREDVLTGYYPIDFNIKYTRGTTTETTTISTYVEAVGAQGSGTLDSTGSEGQSSKPRVIVKGFETTPANVYAGDVFTLDVIIENTSQRTAVSNMQVDMSATAEGTTDLVYDSFLPTSGSNTVYVEEIPAGGTKTISIEMTAKADLTQKPYVLDVNMEYEDNQFNTYTSTASVSIPILQESKFDVSTPEVMPASINVGAQSNVMYSIYNTGKTTLYNVQAKFVGDSISGGDVFVGKIESGATGNVDAMITGMAPTMDDGSITAIITYEDDAGNQTTYEQVINLYVMEFYPDDMMGGYDDYLMEEEVSSGPNVIALVIGAIVLVGAITVIVLKVRQVRRAKRELEQDLEDLDDDDVDDDTV
ncbi:MAG: hypothetical protein R3Y67_01485 [Eubacteriales bacterium]